MAVRDLARTTAERARTSWRSTGVVVLVVGGGLVVAFLLVHLLGVPSNLIASDPDDIAKAPVFYGSMALFGFAVWGAGAGAATVGFVAHLGRPDPLRVETLLWQTAVLTTYLAVDDMYQLHENGYPSIGIPQELVIGIYGVVALLWLWFNRRAILASDFPILVVAFLGFALSILIDQEVFGIALGPFAEDAPKIIGVCLWSLWLARTAIALVRGSYDEAAAPERGRRVGL